MDLVQNVISWHNNQIDHLRPSDALGQMCLDAQHGVQFVAQQCRAYAGSMKKRVCYVLCV